MKGKPRTSQRSGIAKRWMEFFNILLKKPRPANVHGTTMH